MRMFAVAAFLSFAVAASASPCSIFAYAEDGTAYFCGNEDWTATDPALRSYPASEGSYAYVLLGWKRYLPRYAQAGINSEGLCFDWATYPAQPFVNEPGKETATLDSAVDILKTCRTVEEAIAYIERRNYPHLAEEHLVLADRSGASCVIEYSRAKLRVLRGGGRFQAATNFHLADPSLGWFPCERYATMERMLRAGLADRAVREERLDPVAVLRAVSQDGAYPTAYSYVFDLDRMTLRVFVARDYSKERRFDFRELAAASRLVDLSAK